jgi:hypothetical protein
VPSWLPSSCRLTLVILAVAVASANVAWSAPITFRASGVIESVSDDPTDPFLADVPVGTPWQLDVVLDLDIGGEPGLVPNSYFFFDTDLSAEFQLGEFRYVNDGTSFLVTNYSLIPAIPVAGPGQVSQRFFSWESIGAPGAPDLSQGFLTVSWNDLNALDGSLPAFPALAPIQSELAGLRYQTFTGLSGFASDYRPFLVTEPTPVPEPSTLILLGAGVVAIAANRFRALSKK